MSHELLWWKNGSMYVADVGLRRRFYIHKTGRYWCPKFVVELRGPHGPEAVSEMIYQHHSRNILGQRFDTLREAQAHCLSAARQMPRTPGSPIFRAP